MASLLVFASFGKAFDLNCASSTRVDEVQQALASLSGVPVSDQILVYRANGLDSRKYLGDYGLPPTPEEGAASADPPAVFLYSRQHLLPGSAPPPPTDLTPIQAACDFPDPGSSPHPVEQSPNPTVRALGAQWRAARAESVRAQALESWSQSQLSACQAALGECHVMGLSVEAALSNVDHHFIVVDRQVQGLLSRHVALRSWTEGALRSLERDLDALAAVPLHPRARTPAARTLLDLVPLGPDRVREWGGHCSRLHRAVEGKVARLEADHRSLAKEVEELLLRAPRVDLESLRGGVDATAAYLRIEGSPILAALRADFSQVEALLGAVAEEEGIGMASAGPASPPPPSGSLSGLASLSNSVMRGAGRGLHLLEAALHGGRGAGGAGPKSPPSVSSGGYRAASEALRSLERMHERHLAVCEPVMRELEARTAAMCRSCAEGRAAMLRDSRAQLSGLAALQTSLRSLQSRTRALEGVMAQWEEDVAQLGVLRQIPRAYRLCMREVVRQRAAHEALVGEAQRAAEGLARARDAEASRRRALVERVAPFLPLGLIQALGALGEPPLCEISVAASGRGASPSGGGAVGAEVTREDCDALDRVLSGRGLAPTGGGQDDFGAESATILVTGEPSLPAPSPPEEPTDLQLARLRAELAAARCREALRDLDAGAGPGVSGTAAAGEAAGSAPAVGSGSGGRWRSWSAQREASRPSAQGQPAGSTGSTPSPSVQGPAPLARGEAGIVATLRDGIRAKDDLLVHLHRRVAEQAEALRRCEQRVGELEGQLRAVDPLAHGLDRAATHGAASPVPLGRGHVGPAEPLVVLTGFEVQRQVGETGEGAGPVPVPPPAPASPAPDRDNAVAFRSYVTSPEGHAMGMGGGLDLGGLFAKDEAESAMIGDVAPDAHRPASLSLAPPEHAEAGPAVQVSLVASGEEGLEVRMDVLGLSDSAALGPSASDPRTDTPFTAGSSSVLGPATGTERKEDLQRSFHLAELAPGAAVAGDEGSLGTRDAASDQVPPALSAFGLGGESGALGPPEPAQEPQEHPVPGLGLAASGTLLLYQLAAKAAELEGGKSRPSGELSDALEDLPEID